MKLQLISTAILSISTLVANSSTLVVHGAKDNWLEVRCGGSALICPQQPQFLLLGMNDPEDYCETYQLGYWDFGNDIDSPQYAYSGVWSYTNHCVGEYDTEYVGGWNESLSFNGEFRKITFTLTGGFPNYSGDWFESAIDLFSTELWIDFDSAGTVRVSIAAPSDFGKWSWNGSLNPNYVGSLLSSKNKKHHK